MCVGSSPSQPNPGAVSKKQMKSTIQTAKAQQLLNMLNQSGPGGTVKYRKTGSEKVGGVTVPTYEAHTKLSPEQQKIYGQTRGIANQLLKGIRRAGAPQLSDMGSVEDALYGRSTRLLDPQYQKEQQDLETQLVNQGFSRNSEAFNKAMDFFTRSKNDAYAQARQNALLGAGQEQSRLFGLENQARSQPINELMTLLGASPQVTGTPGAGVSTPQVGLQAPDIASMIYNNAAQRNSNYQGMLGGLGSLGGTLAGGALMSPWVGNALGFGGAAASDPKMKTDVRAVQTGDMLKKLKDTPVTTWRYKGTSERRAGPMADDWAEKFGGDGHVIPMPQLMGVMLGAIKDLDRKVEKRT